MKNIIKYQNRNKGLSRKGWINFNPKGDIETIFKEIRRKIKKT